MRTLTILFVLLAAGCAGTSAGTDVRVHEGRGRTEVTELDLSGGAVGDADLEALSTMTGLRRLSLRDTRVTDDGLVWIARLPHLEELDLSGTEVTGIAFVHLRDIPTLRRLELARTKTGDTAIENGAGLKRLEYLGLRGTEIGDNGAVHVTDIRSLKKVDVRDTRITPEGVAMIRRLLPDAEVLY